MNEADLLSSIPGLTIREKIGSGGMGAVYKAYQPTLDRTVALKTVRPEYVTKAGLELFQREAQVLAKIRHPKIVHILEFHPEYAIPYILMEYVDGIPLDEALRGRPWKEQVALFKEVVATVIGAHDQGVVHGDLKPSNILVDRRSQPFVLDFGLARLTRSQGQLPDGPKASGGTPAFLAPEVLGGGPSTFQSDVFALGVTLYFLLTGVLPFRGQMFALEGDPRLPLEHNPNIPEPLQRICLKAMEFNPDERYQTAEMLHADLARFQAGKAIYVRPTLYKTGLDGRIQNHLADLQLWEKEGLVSQREMDVLVLPYDQLRGQDSPWLSETRRVLTGPMLMRIGAWLVLAGVLLWPVFFWSKLSQTERVATAAVPTGVMATLGAWFLLHKNRRNALACLGSFAMLHFVLVLVLFSEFGWLRFPQPPLWELWGSAVKHGLPKDREFQLLRGIQDEMHRPGEIPEALRQRQAQLDELEKLEANLRSLDVFILSNSQILASLAMVTMCLALLMFLLKAPFLAPWLTAAILGLTSAGLLLVGDKARLLTEDIAWVAVHYLGVSAMLFFVGWYIEERTTPRVARYFYWTGTILFVLAAVAIAAFGTQEWFKEKLSLQNKIFNFWLMAYSVPFFLCGFLSERYGTEGQRNLAWFYYYLFPMFLFFPLNVLVGEGWELISLGGKPLDTYEAAYLLACIALLALGRFLHTKVFILVGLWGIVFFVFRMTFRHLQDYLSWPWVVGLLGGALVVVGIMLPLWIQRRRDGVRLQRKAALAAGPTLPSTYEAETLPMQGST